MRHTLHILIVSSLLFTARAGHAQPTTKGHVLQVAGDKIYVGLGAHHGVGAGSKLTLLHAIEAEDPVSKRKLRDTFPIGTLTVLRSGDTVCLASATKSLLARVRAGDEVSLRSPRRVFVDPWKEHIRRQKTRVGGPGTTANPRTTPANALARINAAELVRATWQQTLNKTAAQRIAIWRGYALAHPRSPYLAYVKRELSKLRSLARTEARLADAARDGDPKAHLRIARLAALVGRTNVSEALAIELPSQTNADTALALAFTVLRPKSVGAAWLYYRKRGETSFRRTKLSSDGDHYLRATIAKHQVRAPGLDLFVEALPPNGGQPMAVWASQASPRSVDVSPRVDSTPPKRRNRSRVTMFTDYVDFDGGWNNGFDQYLHAEIDFMYRFYKPIYSMRVGFGTLGGVGGPKDIIDDDPDGCMDTQGRYRCRRVSFHYAYTELEFRASNVLAFMLRPQFGHGTSDNLPGTGPGRCDGIDINGCEIFSAIGLRARVRIGDEQATNLTLGIGVTEKVGTLFEAAFTWDVMPRFPVVLSAQVTDQPVIENFGVRLIGDVGWRAVDWFYPSLRLAFQARDVDHDGFSAGLAMNFDW